MDWFLTLDFQVKLRELRELISSLTMQLRTNINEQKATYSLSINDLSLIWNIFDEILNSNRNTRAFANVMISIINVKL